MFIFFHFTLRETRHFCKKNIFIEMDDYNGVDRLLFFEQYLKRLRFVPIIFPFMRCFSRSEKEDFFKETLERLLSTTLELPFVEECRKLYIKERKPKKSGKCFGAPLNMYQFERLDPLIQTIRIDIHKEGLFRYRLLPPLIFPSEITLFKENPKSKAYFVESQERRQEKKSFEEFSTRAKNLQRKSTSTTLAT